jgi:predicted HTH domain antitoxin
MKLAFEMEVPDGAIDTGAAEAEFVRSVKEQTILKLYSEQRITTGEAAEMLGLTRIEFLDLLRRTGVGFFVELDEEDVAQLRRLRNDHLHHKSGP